MLLENKPWKKALFENFLIILSLLGVIVARIIGKIFYGNFNIYSMLVMVVAFVGFILITYSKREQLKLKDFFSLGVKSQDPADKNYYRLGYFLLITGLLLSFII